MTQLNKITSKDAITNLIKYSNTHSDLLNKYSSSFFLSYFDKYTIEQLEEIMGHKSYTEMEFVRILTNFILHPKDQTLFLAMALIDIFGKIVEEKKKDKETVKVKDFTHFLCKDISNQDSDIVLHPRQIAPEKVVQNSTKPRDIDINSATIHNYPQKESPKISKTIKKIQRRVDNQKPLHSFQINHRLKQIITLGRLSSQINIFNLQLNKIKTIVPHCLKLYRNAAIMSIAFSQKQQRIGCIMAHAGLAFWDYQDQFNTEKIIKKYSGDRIFFLDVIEEWATTTHNTIYIWDLKMEKVKLSIHEPQATALHHIEEIRHLRCIAAAYSMKDQHKWIYIYKNDGLKTGSKIQLKNPGAQKIHYHKNTQTLLLTGNNELPVYQIDHKTLDLSPLIELVGHQSMITSITDLSDGLVISGDDKGNLRIWDLGKMRCQQVLHVSNSLTLLEYFQGNLIFGDSRLNLIKLEQASQKIPLRQQYGIYTYFSFKNINPELYLFTNFSCRLYNPQTGRIKKIIQLCSSQEQIILVQNINNNFLLSTSKYNLYCYSHQLKLQWKISANSSTFLKEQITHLATDSTNNMFTTVTKDGSLFVWSDNYRDGPRKSLVNSDIQCCYQISLFDFSAKFGIMLTTDRTSSVKIWDYQSCKILYVLKTQVSPCVIKIAEHYPLIAVGCPNDKVYLYQFHRKENFFSVQFINYGHLLYPNSNSQANSLLSVDSTLQMILLASTSSLVNPNSNSKSRFSQSKTISQGIVFCSSLKNQVMLVNYGKGHIIAFDVSDQCLHIPQSHKSFKSANVQRPVKQYLLKQFTNGNVKYLQPPDCTLICKDKLNARWNKNIHQDIITCMGTAQQYLTTLCLNGQLKITKIQFGEVIAALNIRQPLPSIWKLELSQEQSLCKKVYKTLNVISSIISDKEVPKDQKDVFQIQWFMKQICTKPSHSSFKKRRNPILLLKQESTSINKDAKSQSLKSMEAFKRVSLIRKGGAASIVDSDCSHQKRFLSSMKEKEQMIRVLAPHYHQSHISRLDSQKYGHLFAKSTQVSPSRSQQKDKPKDSKILVDHLPEKKLLKHQSRSLSQTIRNIYPPIKPLKEDTLQRQMQVQLHGNEPIKELSNFINHLNQKLPKKSKCHKHLKKHSGVLPKFA